jgi:predicted metal-dependent hydrolase
MTDESKLSRAVDRQARGQAILGNELLQEAFAELDAAYVREWRIMSFRDTEARERLWQAVNVLGKVKDHLARVLTDGKLAQREIDQLTEKRKRFLIV